MTTDFQRRFGSLTVKHPVLHGRLASGRAATLVGGYESGGQWSIESPSAGSTIVTAVRAFIGALIDDPLVDGFRAAVIRFTLLDAWLPATRMLSHFDRGETTLTAATLRWNRAPERTVHLPFGRLTFGHDFAETGDKRTEGGFTQHAAVLIRSDLERPSDWWFAAVAKPIRHLLSLATERPIDVVSMRVYPSVEARDDEIEVVWASDLVKTGAPQPADARDLLFWCSDLDSRFQSAIEAWFATSGALEPVLDLYFATFHTRRTYVSTRFLMTAQAAEGYHRGVIGGTDAPPAVHAERLRQAIAGVDPQHRGFVKLRLKSNEPTFARRLTELCESVPDVAQLMVGGRVATFVADVIAARNSLTHPDPSKPGQYSPRRLAELSAQLGVILEGVMLARQLGFAAADIARAIERGSRLRELAIAAGRDE